jgi:hypothetical protein
MALGCFKKIEPKADEYHVTLRNNDMVTLCNLNWHLSNLNAGLNFGTKNRFSASQYFFMPIAQVGAQKLEKADFRKENRLF